MMKILRLKWVRAAIRIGIVGIAAWLLVKGFMAVVVEPVVDRKLKPIQEELTVLRADSVRMAELDSLKSVQLASVQKMLLDLKKEKLADSTKMAQYYSKKVGSLQRLIQNERADKLATKDSLRKAESGVRIDVIKLKYGLLGKLRDSTYIEGYKWPYYDNSQNQ